ncbi:MAG: hypothetical protein U1E76_24460 [Planctomycetota bacterium]
MPLPSLERCFAVLAAVSTAAARAMREQDWTFIQAELTAAYTELARALQ